MAPLDQWEKVLSYLLQKAHRAPDAPSPSDEDIVREISNVDIDAVLATFTPEQVSPVLKQSAVSGAVRLSQWFEESRFLSVHAKETVSQWKAQRLAMAQLPDATPEAALAELTVDSRPHSDVAATLKEIALGFSLKAFCLKPTNSDAAVHAKTFDIEVLALMGFVVVSGGRFGVANYDDHDEDGLRALNRLQSWDEAVQLAEVQRGWLPERRSCVEKPVLSQDVADEACSLIKRAFQGNPVTLERMPCPVRAPEMPCVIPETQGLPGEGQETREAALPNRGVSAPGAGFTQAANDDDEVGTEGPVPKRLRSHPPLAVTDWSNHPSLMAKVLAYLFSTRAKGTAMRKPLKEKYKSLAAPGELDKLITVAFRVLDAMGLATLGAGGSSLEFMAPSGQQQGAVVQRLHKLLGSEAPKAEAIEECFSRRPANESWSTDMFENVCDMIGQSLQGLPPAE